MGGLSWQAAGTGPEISGSSLVLKQVASARSHPQPCRPLPTPQLHQWETCCLALGIFMSRAGPLGGSSPVITLPEVPHRPLTLGFSLNIQVHQEGTEKMRLSHKALLRICVYWTVVKALEPDT